jgi:hypothetical protein
LFSPLSRPFVQERREKILFCEISCRLLVGEFLHLALLEEQHLQKIEKEKDRLARAAARAYQVKSKKTKESNKENIPTSPLPKVCSTKSTNTREMCN